MLQEVLSLQELAKCLGHTPAPRCYESAANREFWNARLAHPVRRAWADEIVAAARQTKREADATADPGAFLYPRLSALDAFSFIGKGNRVDYETVYFQRRSRLSLFTMAEVLTHTGEFMPEIREGIWELLGELYWTLPAHCSYNPGDPMPRRDRPIADLFCTETGLLLADLVNLLGDDLRRESPELLVWIREETVKRVIDPLSFEPWWFSGRNNWTTWCAMNVLGTLSTFLGGEIDRQTRILRILLEANDRFIAGYPEDGGCDEGPGYFQVSALYLMLFLDEMNRLTGDAYQPVLRSTKLRNMGEYITRVHLTGPWYLSPSDSGARNSGIANAGLLDRYGELAESPILRDFAREALYGFDPAGELKTLRGDYDRFLLNTAVRNFCWVPDVSHRAPVRYPALSLLPDLQIAVMRECPADEFNGTILTLKGGHNCEGHNHNDVGQFELFRNGAPLVVDCGAPVYDRFTFMTEERYKRWQFSAAGHNLPQINGVLQQYGKEYHAGEMLAQEGEVKLDLTSAYPAETGLAALTRQAILAPNGTATIEDAAEMTDGSMPEIEMPLYILPQPVREEDGTVRIGDMRLRCEGLDCIDIECVEHGDARLNYAWGDRLWKLTLRGRANRWKMIFTPIAP